MKHVWRLLPTHHDALMNNDNDCKLLISTDLRNRLAEANASLIYTAHHKIDNIYGRDN